MVKLGPGEETRSRVCFRMGRMGRVFNFSFVIKILEENVIISNYESDEGYDLTDNSECLDK